jgi:hypothetical protein
VEVGKAAVAANRTRPGRTKVLRPRGPRHTFRGVAALRTSRAIGPAWVAQCEDWLLVRLDAGVLDHFAPLDELRLHVISQLFGRAGKTLKAHVLELRLDVRAVDDLA